MKLPASSKNMITFSGVALAVISVCVFWAMFLLDVFGFIQAGKYFGLVLYLVLPVPLIIGLMLIPIGMYRNRRAIREKRVKKRLPILDMNNLRHRNAMLIFILGSIFVGFFIFFLGYQGFHYTESTQFCGQLCHNVMQPEFVTYSNSPHARVACVSCHVGEGADWYAKSKVTGLYQVYASIRNIYQRPIETPILSLRPARETCEQCHWPGKLFPARERRFNHYIEEEGNKLWTIKMLVEIGGATSDLSQSPGSHWHINQDVKVEYIATDRKRFEIPWVRLTNTRTGVETVFQSEESPLDPEQIPNFEPRTMDCIDCHTRPSHNFNSPKKSINNYMFRGRISSDLPEIKSVSMELLVAEYTSQDSAAVIIRKSLKEYYDENYPEIAAEKSLEIESAINAVVEIYQNNFFPEMKSNWSVYPDQIGHMEFPGCFRCHNEKLVSEDNKRIGNDCNTCHLITSQGFDNSDVRTPGIEFKHPIDIGEAWKEVACTDCHAPGN